MRRSDREVTEFRELTKIIEKCDVCRIALNNHGFPYIIPLNFGVKITENNTLELYFHGALDGTKYELIAEDNRAGFEMDCGHMLATDFDRGSCTMKYESVVGQGHIEMVKDVEKYDALRILMAHYHQESFPFSDAVVPHTRVFKLVVESMTGKRRT